MRPENDEAFIAWLDAQLRGKVPAADPLEKHPGLTVDDAYRVRGALVRRRVQEGDGLLGYNVAGSNRVVRADEHVEGPMVGAMLKSGLLPQENAIPIGRYPKAFAEAEVAVLLKRDLAGPGVTLADAFAAVECVFPAIEVGASHSKTRPSHQGRIIFSKFTAGIVLGRPMSLNGLDLRLEGVVATHNNVVKGSATGVEVLGHPMNAVVLMANTMAQYEEPLRAGMVLMTGSFLANIALAPGDRVLMEFTRLGTVSAFFEA